MLNEMLVKIKLLLKFVPIVEQSLRQIKHQNGFKTELALIKDIHSNNNTHASIIHFTFNKAASQYVKTILSHCAVENGMTPVSIHGYAFHSEFPFLDHLSAGEMVKYQHIFKKQGYLYSAFGGMVEGIPQLGEYKIIMVTRDPRDILISEYFSTAFSHVPPSVAGTKYNNFMSRRVMAREVSIDDYVVKESDKVLVAFLRYQNVLLAEYPNVYLTSYEQMVSDFSGWLKALMEYCNLNVSKNLFQSLLVQNDRLKMASKENILKHNRKGKPGDYLEKLKPETIRYLDMKFEPILASFGYK